MLRTLSLEHTSPLKERVSTRMSGTATSYVWEDFTAANSVYVAALLRVDALPSATAEIVTIRNGATTVGNLALTTAGTLQLRNGTTVLGTSAALTVGTVYRIGLRQTKGTGSNGILEGFLSAGDSAFGAAFHSRTNLSFTSQATQMWAGATTSTAASVTLDDLSVDTTALPAPLTAAATRTTSYGYDGLHRLTGATESPGTSYSYAYDRAGNRTDGGRTYDNANQVNGWSYDAVGNLLNDSTTSYAYDALSRVASTTRAGTTTTNAYTGDGTLVRQVTGATTTRYTQDLAAPLSQILQVVGTSTTTYLYGHERLAINSSPRTWYLSDGLGSVRRTITESGSVLATTSYDPWGTPQSALSTPFGFTGELQGAAGLTYLRARWYAPGTGTFVSRDAFAGYPEQPYSLNPYQYAYSNPSLLKDPTGNCTAFLSYLAVGNGNYHADLVLDDCRPEVCGCNLAADHWRQVPYRACRKVPTANGVTSAVWMMRAGPEIENRFVPFPLAVPGTLDDMHPWKKLLVKEARDFGTDNVETSTGLKIGGEFAEVEGGDGFQGRLLIMAENGRPCDEYISKLATFAQQFNTDPKWDMTYNPLLRNSNATLRHALEFAGMPRPRGNIHMGLSVPGWDSDLTDPHYFWPETSSVNGFPLFAYVTYKRSERGVR